MITGSIVALVTPMTSSTAVDWQTPGQIGRLAPGSGH